MIKKIKEKITKVIRNPMLIVLHMCRYIPFRWISDKAFIKLFFKTYQGYRLNLNEPKTFNEKLQWLKIYDRNEEYATLTDKYLVRDFVKEKIGENYLIPLLGVWNNTKNIDFSNLPNSFVLKCNHDSGSVVICKNKVDFNKKKTIKILNNKLKKQYFWKSREYNYKNIEPKIIAEQYMIDNDEGELKDYKFFCFNGEPKFIQIDKGRFTNHTRNYYTTNGDFIPVEVGYPNDIETEMDKNIKLNEMLTIAKKLSNGLLMVRVDLYQINNKIYFGEMTFHHGGGGEKIRPFRYDEEWGKLIDLNRLEGMIKN